MSLYRCAACGSPNVVVEKEKDGYNYKKGLLGTVVFGAVGAVAGINGKTKQVYKCPECGLTLSETMPLELKIIIDNAVLFPDIRDKLTLNGCPVSWEFLVSKYKNIENQKIQHEISQNNAVETCQSNSTTAGQDDEDLESVKKEILIELKKNPDGLAIFELQDINQFLHKCTNLIITKAMRQLWHDEIVERFEKGQKAYFKLTN